MPEQRKPFSLDADPENADWIKEVRRKKEVDKLIKQIRRAKDEFGVTCSKFSGSVAVEILRHALRAEGFHVSSRDCFIHRIPIQVDLLITKPDAKPSWELLYTPDDVYVALEVKQVGAFPGTIEKVKRDFNILSAACPHLTCAYVAIEEREGFKLTVTEGNISHPAFTLATYKDPKKEFKLTGDWQRLVKFLRECCPA